MSVAWGVELSAHHSLSVRAGAVGKGDRGCAVAADLQKPSSPEVHGLKGQLVALIWESGAPAHGFCDG